MPNTPPHTHTQSHLHLPLPGGRRLVLNPGCTLPGRLMWGNREERDWPECHGARQIVMVNHHRLFLLLRLHLFLHLFLLAVCIDLGGCKVEGGGDEGGSALPAPTAPPPPPPPLFSAHRHRCKGCTLFSELCLRAAKALWRCSPHSSAEGRAESLGGEMTPR